MSEFVANLIWIIHVLFIIWFVVTPFVFNSPEMVLLHVMTGLTLMVHWVFNSDECALTLMETKIRGVEKTDSFFHSLVSPIYKFESDAALRKSIWILTIVLWSISVMKLVRNPGMIKEVFEKAWRGPAVSKVECGQQVEPAPTVTMEQRRVLIDDLPDVPSMKKYYYRPESLL